MTKRIELHLSPSRGFLDTARRIEYVLLLGLSAIVVLYPLIHPLAAIPLLILAIALVPRQRASAKTREAVRLDVVNSLHAAGLELRAKLESTKEEALTLERSDHYWEACRAILVWIENCSRDLKRYPEVAGIFEDHDRSGGLLAELDVCLDRLSHIRRLLNLSERLQLPI